jgi:WD40 repeat protein
LALASDDTTVKIWDTDSWTEVFTLRGPMDWVPKAVFSHDGSRIAAASNDGSITIWGSPDGPGAASGIGPSTLPVHTHK